jgi:Na+/melibiose symporter-like transporter
VLGGFFDELKVSFQLTLKAMIAGAIFAFAGMAAFICGLVVLFLWTMQTYGVMYAWGAVAAVFGVVALVALIPLLASSRRRAALQRAAELRLAKAEAEKSKDAEWWQNPAALLTGIQIVRTLGIRGTLPILAVAAVAAGFFLSRQSASETDATMEPAE